MSRSSIPPNYLIPFRFSCLLFGFCFINFVCIYLCSLALFHTPFSLYALLRFTFISHVHWVKLFHVYSIGSRRVILSEGGGGLICRHKLDMDTRTVYVGAITLQESAERVYSAQIRKFALLFLSSPTFPRFFPTYSPPPNYLS